MKPPTRKRATTTSKDLPIEEYSRWKLGERKRLLKALEKYSVNQSSEIANMVETKSEVEVIYYLSKLKRSVKSNVITRGSTINRKYLKNIESWIRFTHQLVDDEEESYSSMIGKLLALYGDYCFKKPDSTGVNFKVIYDYLAGLSLGVQCPVLPPLESALVLDLLNNVTKILDQSNTAPHKKYVLLNYQNQVFPNYASSADKGISALRKLFDEVQATPGSILSSMPSQSKTGILGTHEKELSHDDPDATVVCMTQFNTHKKQINPDAQNQTPEVSKYSLTKRKFPAHWRSEQSNNSSFPEAKGTKHLPGISTHKENNTVDEQNTFSEEIPSTSQIVKFTEKNTDFNCYSSEQQENNNLESQQSSGTYLTSKNIKQEFRIISVQTEQNSASDSSPQQESDQSRVVSVTREIIQQGQDCSSVQEEINSDTNIGQTPRQIQILLTNASETFHIPSGEESPQVPTGGTVLHLQNENTIKNNTDNTDVIAQEQSGDAVQKGTLLSNLLQNPNEVTIVQETHDNNIIKISNNPFNQDPKGGTIHKRTILASLLQCPIEDTLQQKAESISILPSSKNTLDLLRPSVHKRSIFSNLLKGPNAGTTQQGADNVVKIFQMTSKGLVEEGFSHASPPQGSGGSTGKQEVKKIEVTQVTNRRLANEELGGISLLKGLSVENSTASQQNKKQSCNKSVKAEFSDSDGDTDRIPYKPSVTWLNPMKIPAQLINFTKTKQKECKN